MLLIQRIIFVSILLFYANYSYAQRYSGKIGMIRNQWMYLHLKSDSTYHLHFYNDYQNFEGKYSVRDNSIFLEGVEGIDINVYYEEGKRGEIRFYSLHTDSVLLVNGLWRKFKMLFLRRSANFTYMLPTP